MTSDGAGSAKANGREPKTCLGQVFHYKLGRFENVYETQVCRCTPTSVVVNLAQVLSCQLKFVHAWGHVDSTRMPPDYEIV